VPIKIIEGELEIGVIVANSALGDQAGKAMGAILAVLLVSTVSAIAFPF
jgi:APA family basic amino acid/polyamine antiporter